MALEYKVSSDDVVPYDEKTAAAIAPVTSAATETSTKDAGLLAPTTATNSTQVAGLVAPSGSNAYNTKPIDDFTSSPVSGTYTAKADNAYTPSTDTTVAGQMSGLLNKNSDYMRAATAGGEQSLLSKGLGNSTMAVEAGQTAAIKSALPIAQQDAGYMQSRGLAEQQGAITSSLTSQADTDKSILSAQEANQTAGIYQVQGNISSQIAKENAQYASLLSKQQAGQELTKQEQGYILSTESQYKLAAQKATYDSLLSAQEAGQTLTQSQSDWMYKYQTEAALEQMQQDGANFRTELEQATNRTIESMKLTDSENTEISQMMERTGTDYQDQLTTIYTDPNMPAETKAALAAEIRSAYEATVSLALSGYNMTIDW